ncbi:hypothetical protein ACFYMW_39165 [Streptomyces sp. NPDC006692]|uniref:hypothetical protein n=1 Tax=unclassified Streptomyces TaxID=2593676 RepID=UPI0036B0987E
MFSIATASGTVHIVPSEPDGITAVRYTLTGAVKGTVHVVASHDPRQWDDFRALRISLGSQNALRYMPAEPLPRIRTRAFTGTWTRRLAASVDTEDGWFMNGGLRDLADREAPPQATKALWAVARACSDHYAARSDLAELQRLARWLETPKLRGWLEQLITEARATITRYRRDEQQHRQDARQCIRSWWFLARMFAEQPSPLLAYLLGDRRESLAHRADYLPGWAEISATGAADELRCLNHFLAEREGLSHRGRRPIQAAHAMPHAS